MLDVLGKRSGAVKIGRLAAESHLPPNKASVTISTVVPESLDDFLSTARLAVLLPERMVNSEHSKHQLRFCWTLEVLC